MPFYQTGAQISKDPIVGLLQLANEDDSKDKLTAIIGAAAGDDGKILIPEALNLANDEILKNNGLNMSYAPSTGIKGLAELISKEIIGQKTFAEFKKLRIKNAELITAGGTNAISTTLLSCTNDENVIVTHNPHWAGYDSIIYSLKYKALLNFDILDENNNFNTESFAETIEKAASLGEKITLVLNTPFDNPLGKDHGDKAWTEIANTLKKYEDKEIVLILDTAYIDFGPGGKDYRRMNYLVKLFETISSQKFYVVIAGTLSKSFAMYGARVGAAILLSRDIETVNLWRNTAGGTIRGTFSNANRMGQEIAMNILQDAAKLALIHDFQAQTVDLISKRKDALVACINDHLKYDEIKMIQPDGGFFLSLRLSQQEINGEKFAVKLHKQLLDSHTYAPLIADEFLRLPVCGLPEEKLKELVARIKHASEEVLSIA